ncbi:dTMP kinase [Phytoactinopolyspora halotolerans]|uniref:Thymidylate kinase n=1 Tax=Phytoactinopolyspora halotolerans TaxID=1981512 RepID=A0A6L9S3C3_9ACTN|nr:dTMP kinase [Phytoactinopolyspora halotolerans]NED99071.1 dTMP kinase [Phytoactinopolyspora halotolerans]
MVHNEGASPRGQTGRGLFIAFEGGDGVGKTTQVELLSKHLRAHGRDVVVTREPGGSRIGKEVRSILLDGGDLDARAEALLFAADRADHVASLIRPALNRGAVVVTDRYTDSSIAYQGVGRELGVEQVAALSEFATLGLKPDLTIVLDLDADERRRRMESLGRYDRIEREPDHVHARIRRAFLDLAAAEPERYVIVDASRPVEQIAAAVAQAVERVN